MAPFLTLADENNMLSKRYYYYCDAGEDSCSNWYRWGRWVMAAVVVIFFFALFVIWGCFSSRRRRRRGARPMYGTGWLSQQPPNYPGPPGHGPGQHQPPPPAYGAPPQQPAYTGTSFSTGQGYYGHHEGIQMQPPRQSYQPNGRGDDAHEVSGANNDYYAPPSGPPPGK
ncbi:uncharacterized protein MKZ38_004790 [Zalerion maritima]|uniref:Uncharacterized protein n=1 Tax=Zalerion maritima TaxID=339359 RepID=A0AAD5RM54_9PEZI|nr:uncharacterized protein MKZ38_004790 [Zalerion maritima]